MEGFHSARDEGCYLPVLLAHEEAEGSCWTNCQAHSRKKKDLHHSTVLGASLDGRRLLETAWRKWQQRPCCALLCPSQQKDQVPCCSPCKVVCTYIIDQCDYKMPQVSPRPQLKTHRTCQATRTTVASCGAHAPLPILRKQELGCDLCWPASYEWDIASFLRIGNIMLSMHVVISVLERSVHYPWPTGLCQRRRGLQET